MSMRRSSQHNRPRFLAIILRAEFKTRRVMDMLLEEAIVPLKVSFLDNMFQCCTTLYQKMCFFVLFFYYYYFYWGHCNLLTLSITRRAVIYVFLVATCCLHFSLPMTISHLVRLLRYSKCIFTSPQENGKVISLSLLATIYLTYPSMWFALFAAEVQNWLPVNSVCILFSRTATQISWLSAHTNSQGYSALGHQNMYFPCWTAQSLWFQ